MEIVTGRTGTPHVTSADHRGIISMISGGVSAIANAYENLAVELAANNVLKIKSGFLLHRGCIGRVRRGTYDEVPFSPGIVGMKRKDLVVARYEHFNDDTEKLDWYVIEGTPDATNPAVPAYEDGNLQLGDTVDDCPFAVITLDGLNASVEVLVKDYNTIKLRETFLAAHPVGRIIFTNDQNNPGDTYGGTWVACGAGRVPVGVDTKQDEFSTVGKTGGEKTHTLTVQEIPSHSHNLKYEGNGVYVGNNNTNYIAYVEGFDQDEFNGSTMYCGDGQAHNNLPPYFTCYMWRRTA